MRLPVRFILLLLVVYLFAFNAKAQSIDPVLLQEINAAPLAQTAVVITYDHHPNSADIAALQTLGLPGGIVLNKLPMVLTSVNKSQFEALRTQLGIVSFYSNLINEKHTDVSRSFIGVTALRKDAELTRLNGGFPVSGKGVAVAIVDTGIDATHSDLQLGKNVKQNVLFPLTELSTIPTNCPAAIVGSPVPGASINFSFLPPTFVENAPISDAEGGHGTFVSGVIGGTGQSSGGFYGGMAPGADLIGVVAGNDCGLPTFGILQAFDYVMVKQLSGQHPIRVVNNSWGSRLLATAFDPANPINVATRMLHDLNIVVVFSAGNSGNTAGAINRYSVAPWVISVAASQREGLGELADFSSRGQDNGTGSDTAGQPADPNAPPNLRPDITAPGEAVKSTRSKGPGITNILATSPSIFVGSKDVFTIPPGFIPFYTNSRGTSFSAPHVSGVVALMLQANPLLTPDEVVTILRATATPMPFEEREVGAGYLDAHNAVRAAAGLAPVPHPANLFPTLATPEIFDIAGDQLGTLAQDIRAADFDYDAATDQLVYTLTLTDVSTRTTNMWWRMGSNFGTTTIFVTAALDETGASVFEYGRITVDPTTGLQNQESLGAADSGEFVGNQIRIRLARSKVNTAVGSDVLGATSTATHARGQILIGTTFSGGLLLNSDSATGRSFVVMPSDPPPPPPPPPADFCERMAGAFAPAQGSVQAAVKIQLPSLDAKLNFHPGNEDVVFDLLNANGNVVASGNATSGKRILVGSLEPGNYNFRLSGTLSNAVDFVINSCQFTPAP